MKNNYFFPGLSRSIVCWLSMLLLGSLAPAGLMAQTTLSTGDIAFVGFNGVDDGGTGNNSNDKFSFVLLKSVTANTRIFFTDFGWLTGGGFQTVSPTAGVGSKDDGIISWTSSTSLAAGTQVVILCKYNLSASTGTVAGVEQVPAQSFFMNIGDPGADNIFAYQAATARDANPTLLAGIRTAGAATTWDATLTNTEFTPAKTTLPAALTANGVNAALYLRGSFYTIAIYKCTVSNGFPKAIRNAINNPANWEYPNPGTFCEGYIYAPNDPACPQNSIPAGYNLPINCTFALTQLQIATQPASKTVCAGQPVSFTSTAVNATDYQWQVSTDGGGSFGNLSNGGVYSGVTSTILTISNTTGLNGNRYRLIASESTEPSSATSSAATLTVNNGPQNLVLNPSGPLSCTSTTVTLTATSTGATSYSFSGPGITAQGSATATVNMAGSYSVVATSASGCTAVATTTVTGDQTGAPTLGLNGSTNPTTCGGTNGSISFTTTNLANGSYSLSYTGAGSPKTVTVTGNAFSLTGLSAGAYSNFSITNSGCTGSVATPVNLTDPAAPTLTLSTATSFCVGQPVTLTATSGFSSYTFTSGAGPVGSGSSSTTTVTGLSAGPYSFSVTATAPNGCTNIASTSTTVNPLPVPTLAVSGTITCAQPTQVLTAGGGTSYTFAGPGLLTTSAGSATVNAGGLYSVTATSSGCSATTSITVSENKTAPTPTLTASSTAVCSPASITLTAGGGVSYTFSAGASQIGSTNQAVVTQSGTYSVIVASANGCTSTTSITVSVNPLPMPTLAVSGTVTCAQPTQTLTAGGGTSYAFAGPGLVAQNTATGSATVNAGGLYSVTATTSGCSATTSVTVFENKTAPTPTLTASSTAVCSPASITLTAGGGVSYTFSAGASQIGSTNQAVVTQSGTYSVIVANANGCTSTTSITVSVNPLPAAPTLTGVSRSVTQSNTPLSLLPFVTATGSNVLSFSGAAGVLNPPTVDISQVGVQDFLVTQTDANGCTSTATPFSLTVQPSIPADQTVCRSSPAVLTSITVGARYEWYKNGTSAPFKLTEIASIQRGTRTASLTVVSPQTTANYYLKVFAADGSFVFEGPFKLTVDYNCVAGSPRQAAPELVEVSLSIVLTANPVTDGKVRAVVRGAGGKALTVTLFNLRGQPAGEQRWAVAESEQTVELPIGTQPSGIYLLQAQSPDQRQTIRVIKP